MMELRKSIAPFLPSIFKSRVYNELWLKDHIGVKLREHEDALTIKTKPLPYVELLFAVSNDLPVPLQVYGASIEIWLGKPVVQFLTFVSESLRPGENRETLRAVHFLNPFQLELLNPPKKEAMPPNVTVIITILCRSSLGLAEKTVKTTWIPPKVY